MISYVLGPKFSTIHIEKDVMGNELLVENC